MAVLLLCLGLSLTLPDSGSQDDLSALGMADVLPVDQRENGNAPPLDGSYYHFALAEEADVDPLNAGLLSMLKFAAASWGRAL